MKQIIIVIAIIFTIPLYAGVGCMDNSQHLQRGPFDTKTWHFVACDCPCTTVRNGRCVECEHLHDAHAYTVINTHEKRAYYGKTTHIATPKAVFNALMHKFFKKKLTRTAH